MIAKFHLCFFFRIIVQTLKNSRNSFPAEYLKHFGGLLLLWQPWGKPPWTSSWITFFYRQAIPPFFFRFALDAFPDIGSVGRIEKKKKDTEKKLREVSE